MNKLTLISVALTLLFLSSCNLAKQTIRQSGVVVNWAECNSFTFGEINYDGCPAVIGESVIQEIQECVIEQMNKKGIVRSTPSDLIVNLDFSFSNPNFIAKDDAEQLKASMKYTTKGYKKMTQKYYTDGIITMTVLSTSTKEIVFTSTIKGFVNADGSEVANGTILEYGVSSALFKGFPKTGKMSIAKKKRIEEKKKERELRKTMYR